MNWKEYSPVKDAKELVGFLLLGLVVSGVASATENTLGLGHAQGLGKSLGESVAKMLPEKK